MCIDRFAEDNYLWVLDVAYPVRLSDCGSQPPLPVKGSNVLLVDTEVLSENSLLRWILSWRRSVLIVAIVFGYRGTGDGRERKCSENGVNHGVDRVRRKDGSWTGALHIHSNRGGKKALW